MYTKVELLDAIDQLNEAKHTVQNCEKLAAVYTVLNNLYPEDHITFEGYSGDAPPTESIVSNHGKSEFLSLIAGKEADKAWLMIDELMVTLQVLNPQLYQNVLNKLKTL